MAMSQNRNQINSPYLDARREWNERYGNYIQAAKTWRYVAFAAISIAIISVTGVVYFASQNKLIPYVVEVNSEGKTLQVYQADKMRSLDRRVVKAQLSKFIQDVRSVSSDVAVQRQAIHRAYAHLSTDMPAYTAVNTWFRNNVPFDRAKEETNVVEVRQILPLSEDTWRIEWIERSRSRTGEEMQESKWTGTTSLVTGAEVDSSSIMLNPIGLYIKEFDWSQDFNVNE